MSELFLIAHSVRGEAAFDVATKMECPHCHGNCICNTCGGSGFTGEHNYSGVCSECAGQSTHGCFDCDSLGFWWIIPTSGHRAWPWRWWPLEGFKYECEDDDVIQPLVEIQNGIPLGWPDHFKSLPAPKVDITSLFRAAQTPKPRIARRL